MNQGYGPYEVTLDDRLDATYCKNKFYKFPQVLLGRKHLFQGMSLEAKVLYMLLRDRHEMACEYNAQEPDGRHPIYFTVQEVQDTLGCANKKAIRIFRELEEWGMIERVRQGMNRASKIYVNALEAKSYPHEVVV